MPYTTSEILNSLISNITVLGEVTSIGISGSKTQLPKAGESDIDVFIYCTKIPSSIRRQDILTQSSNLVKNVKIDVFQGGHWGTGDYVEINGVETWLMYFTVEDTLNEVNSILNGEHLNKLDSYYYPIGRLAMLRSISILYDKTNFLSLLKGRLIEYPKSLSKILVRYHFECLEDNEDFQRAVNRKDVLFYHFALDLALDHFLQALFAINRTYFPSRKRNLNFIENFDTKPEKCSERLLELVKLGSFPEGIEQSYKLWNEICKELSKLIEF